jgi:hypothetical protein
VYEPFQLASDDSIQQIRETAAQDEGDEKLFSARLCAAVYIVVPDIEQALLAITTSV